MGISNEQELGNALKSDQDTIVIEGDLKKKVIIIRGKGKVAWAIAFGAIGIAVTIIISSGGSLTPAGITIGTGAIAVLGYSTAVAAVAIAVAAGGTSALNKLRNYREVSRTANNIVLKRK